MRVVICGGGVIGACTAYFLSRRGIDVVVIERTEVGAEKVLASCRSGPRDGRLIGLPCAIRARLALRRRPYPAPARHAGNDGDRDRSPAKVHVCDHARGAEPRHRAAPGTVTGLVRTADGSRATGVDVDDATGSRH
jgi:glycine/D-amino acid oxidase-like deaminating enzyme